MKYFRLTLLLSTLLVTPLAHGGSGISSEDDNDNNTQHSSQIDHEEVRRSDFYNAIETPGFGEALTRIIMKKMQHFRYLQTPPTHDTEPSLAEEYELTKQDRAQSYQRKLHYKTRDRQKNNPYSRDRHDEDKSVKHQSRIAKVLWAASSHNAARQHDHKRESHGKRAYAQYLQNLPQNSITYPQLRTNNATVITSMPPISSETPTSPGIGIFVPDNNNYLSQDNRNGLIVAIHQLHQELQNVGKLRTLVLHEQTRERQRQPLMIASVQIQPNDCSIL